MLRLREATMDDAALLWHWANDPDVRSAGSHRDPIPLSEHLLWLQSQLDDPSVSFLVAVDLEDTPVGQIRLQTIEEATEIHFSLAAEFRGRGLATSLLQHASGVACASQAAVSVFGRVRSTNQPSCLAFKGAGFKEVGTDDDGFLLFRLDCQER